MAREVSTSRVEQGLGFPSHDAIAASLSAMEPDLHGVQSRATLIFALRCRARSIVLIEYDELRRQCDIRFGRMVDAFHVVISPLPCVALTRTATTAFRQARTLRPSSR